MQPYPISTFSQRRAASTARAGPALGRDPCHASLAPQLDHFKCELTIFDISNMEKLFFGNTFDSAASGVIVRPDDNFFALMYPQIFFVTSVRAIVLAPQIAASSALSDFGAKIPTPFFFE